MAAAGGMAHQHDIAGIAAVTGDVLDHPSNRASDILRAGRKLRCGREPIFHVDDNKALMRKPIGDIVVKLLPRVNAPPWTKTRTRR